MEMMNQLQLLKLSQPGINMQQPEWVKAEHMEQTVPQVTLWSILKGWRKA